MVTALPLSQTQMVWSVTQPHCTGQSLSRGFRWTFELFLVSPALERPSSVLAEEASRHSNEGPGGKGAYGQERVGQPGHGANQGETEMTGVLEDPSLERPQP